MNQIITQIFFIFLGHFKQILGNLGELSYYSKNCLRNSQMSFILIYQTFADIAAHLVTQTINWQGILVYYF